MKIISSFILLLLLLLHYNTASASSVKNRMNQTLLMNGTEMPTKQYLDKDNFRRVRNTVIECVSQCLAENFNRRSQKKFGEDCAAGTYKNNASGNDKCVKCPSGTYSTAGASQCRLCAAGTFNNEIGQTTCHKCPAGSYTDSAGSSSCFQCSPGSYSASAGSNSCFQCSPGSYSPSAGSNSCFQCSPGSYSEVAGSSSCFQCSPGSYSASAGSSSCTQCSPGSYSASAGRTSCIQCSPGSYSAPAGRTSCFQCSPGSYSASAGSSSCIQCSPGSNSASAGRTSCTQCEPGYFAANNGSSSCSICPNNTYSTSSAATSCQSCNGRVTSDRNFCYQKLKMVTCQERGHQTLFPHDVTVITGNLSSADTVKINPFDFKYYAYTERNVSISKVFIHGFYHVNSSIDPEYFIVKVGGKKFWGLMGGRSFPNNYTRFKIVHDCNRTVGSEVEIDFQVNATNRKDFALSEVSAC